MIKFSRFSRTISVFLLLLAISFAPMGRAVVAQQPAKSQPTTAATPDYSNQLAAIEKAIDDKRKELGIPGMSLVIVKDDRIIYMKGLGVKDFERQVPVTPDTLFAIGSASKAFTAMLALMSADEGKVSLDDSPKKFLPYFKLRDADADAKITLRDLLSHRSGLNRTDIAMVSGVLNREELIQVAAMAKPTAKLGEKFQYQNVMYTAAGEAVARAQNSTWDKLIETRLFKPLGMKGAILLSPQCKSRAIFPSATITTQRQKLPGVSHNARLQRPRQPALSTQALTTWPNGCDSCWLMEHLTASVWFPKKNSTRPSQSKLQWPETSAMV